MTLPQIAILFIAAVLGGTLNSVAGGGSFFTFPALVFVGVPVISAILRARSLYGQARSLAWAPIAEI